MPGYTPFFEKTVQQITGAHQRRYQGQTAQKAAQGNEEALGQLYSVNPKLAIQISNELRRKANNETEQQRLDLRNQQYNQQVQERAEDRKRQVMEENRNLFESTVRKATGYNTFEEAKPHMDREYQRIAQQYPEIAETFPEIADGFDEEDWEAAQASSRAGGGNVQRSVEVPGQGFNKINGQTGEVVFTPYSLEQRQAYMKAQEEELAHIESKEAARLMAGARQDLRNEVNEAAFKAREQMPQLERLKELSAVVDSGAYGEQATDLRRFFGADVANEEEFMSLSNQQILNAADSLSGALSDRENRYLEAVAPSIGKSAEGNMQIINNILTISRNAIKRQEALREFKGNPIDFEYQGEPFNDFVAPDNYEDMSDEDLMRRIDELRRAEEN